MTDNPSVWGRSTRQTGRGSRARVRETGWNTVTCTTTPDYVNVQYKRDMAELLRKTLHLLSKIERNCETSVMTIHSCFRNTRISHKEKIFTQQKSSYIILLNTFSPTDLHRQHKPRNHLLHKLLYVNLAKTHIWHGIPQQ